jgi:hypothetical protein
MITVNLSLGTYGMRYIPHAREVGAVVGAHDGPAGPLGPAAAAACGGGGLKFPASGGGSRDKAAGKELCFSNISIKKNEPLKLKRGKPMSAAKGKTVLEKVLGISILQPK